MLVVKESGFKEIALPEEILYTSKVLSYTANELYGWSYPVYGGSRALIYTRNDLLDGKITPLRQFKYLKDYNEDIGFLKTGFPTAERVICDYLMYPRELGIDLYLCEALEGYIEDNGDFSKVYELMSKLKIDGDLIKKYIAQMYQGCDD